MKPKQRRRGARRRFDKNHVDGWGWDSWDYMLKDDVWIEPL